MVTKGQVGPAPGHLLHVALWAGLVLLSPAAPRAEEQVVKLGDLLAMSNMGAYIAIEKGYFQEQGIRNEITTFASSAKMIPALAAGEMEVSLGAASAGLFNSIRQGAGFRIVADKSQNRPGKGCAMLTVRKDLVDSGQVKSVKDLKGKRVAIFAKGTFQNYVMGKMAEEVGLTIKDFDITYLAAPQQVTAFETKAIDAAMTAEPWGARFAERGLAVRFRTADQIQGPGPLQSGVVVYSGAFIGGRRSVAQRWMHAYLEGLEFYDAKGLHDAEVLAIIEKYTKVPARVIKASIPCYQDPRGRMNVDSLADQIAWHVANGYMPQRVRVDQVVDLSFLP